MDKSNLYFIKFKKTTQGKPYISICDTVDTKNDFVRTECIINVLAVSIVFIL